MLTTISEADIQRTGVTTISVGQVKIGPIQIGQLVLTDLGVNVAAAGAHLHNFRITIAHVMTLDWHIHIDLSPLPPIDESGTVDLGNPSFSVNLGDISVPGLQNIKIDIASLTADHIAASADPVTNLQLGAAVAEQIRARNLKLPLPGFTIAGAAVGSFQANGIGVPAGSVDGVTIGRVHGEAFPLGQLTLANLALPSAAVPDIVSQAVDVTATPIPKAFHIDLGILDQTLKIKPTVEAQIDQLSISNASASTSIGRIEMHNVVAPYELLNLTLSQIGIESIQIPTFMVS